MALIEDVFKGNLAAGLAVRQREEEDVNRLERCPALELQVGATPQVRVHAVHELSTEALGRDLGHLDFRVREQQAEQLATGISGAADHGSGPHRTIIRRAG